MKHIIFIILFIPFLLAEDDSTPPNYKINLEDIERDNILSEKLAKKNKNNDVFDIQQSQSYHSKNLAYYREQLKQLKELQDERQKHIQKSISGSETSSIEQTSSGPGGIVYASIDSTSTRKPYDEVDVTHHNAANIYSYPRQQHLENAINGHHNTQTQLVEQVQYVTVTPHSYRYQDDGNDVTSKANHEDDSSSNTYSPSHQYQQHTLVRPIAPTIVPYYQQQQQQQQPEEPQYVYIQPNRPRSKSIQPALQVTNDIQYTGNNDGAYNAVQQHSTPDTIVFSRDDGVREQVETQTKVDGANAEQPVYQQSSENSHQIQYVPYIGQGPSKQQSYVTMVAIPSHYNHNAQPIKFTPSVITYSHSGPASVTPVLGGLHPSIQYIPTAAGAAPLSGPLQYVNINDVAGSGEPVSPAPEYSPQPDIQYADPSQTASVASLSDVSKQSQYAPQHPERQLPQKNPIEAVSSQLPSYYNKLQYIPSQRVVPLPQYQYLPTPQINVQPLHSYQPIGFPQIPYRQPKSLLDSYVPSWIVVQQQRIRQQQQKIYQQQQYYQQQQQEQQQRSLGPTSYYRQEPQQIVGPIDQHVQQQQQQYNTIAYSSYLEPTTRYHQFINNNHLKRSTKLKKIDEKKN